MSQFGTAPFFDYPVFAVAFNTEEASAAFLLSNGNDQVGPFADTGTTSLVAGDDEFTTGLLEAINTYLTSATFGGQSISGISFTQYNETTTVVTP
jgi:hypothetical protein